MTFYTAYSAVTPPQLQWYNFNGCCRPSDISVRELLIPATNLQRRALETIFFLHTAIQAYVGSAFRLQSGLNLLFMYSQQKKAVNT